MSQLNEEMALACAERYIIQKEDPIGKGSGFNSYYIRVGQDLSHQPDSIYAENLVHSELELMTDEMAKKMFWNHDETASEFLVKIMVNIPKKKLTSRILTR